MDQKFPKLKLTLEAEDGKKLIYDVLDECILNITLDERNQVTIIVKKIIKPTYIQLAWSPE